MSQVTRFALQSIGSNSHVPKRQIGVGMSTPSSVHLDTRQSIGHGAGPSPDGTAPQLQQSSKTSQSPSTSHAPPRMVPVVPELPVAAVGSAESPVPPVVLAAVVALAVPELDVPLVSGPLPDALA